MTSVIIWAQGNYYDSANGLSGTALQNQLRIITTNGHTPLGYDTAKARMFQNIDNENGYVRCVYTGQDFNVGYNYTGSTSPNTEHSYCQSWFDGMPEYSTMRCDLHHLYPTEMTVNSSRGNLPLDDVVNANNTYGGYNGYYSKRGTNAQGITVFEPADQHKGDVARALLYMSVRYAATLTIANVNMFPTLIEWNYEDPVSTWETNRNEAIYTYQHNRNPFVDHPEYVNLIWNTDVSDETISAPIMITTVFPNPSKDNFTITFRTSKTTETVFSVYDVKGRRVSVLKHRSAQPGEYAISWNGRDNRNQPLANGLYFLKSIDSVKTTKLIILK